MPKEKPRRESRFRAYADENGKIPCGTHLEIDIRAKTVDKDLAKKLPDIKAGKAKLDPSDVKDLLHTAGVDRVLHIGMKLENFGVQTRQQRIGLDLMAAARETFTHDGIDEGFERLYGRDGRGMANMIAHHNRNVRSTPDPDPIERIGRILRVNVTEKGLRFKKAPEPAEESTVTSIPKDVVDAARKTSMDDTPPHGIPIIRREDAEAIKAEQTDPFNVPAALEPKAASHIKDMMRDLSLDGGFPEGVVLGAGPNSLLLVATGKQKHMVRNTAAATVKGDSAYVSVINEPVKPVERHPYVLQATADGLHIRNPHQVPADVKKELGLEDIKYNGDGIPGVVDAVSPPSQDPRWRKYGDAPVLGEEKLGEEMSRADRSNPAALGLIARVEGAGGLFLESMGHYHKINRVTHVALDGDRALYVRNKPQEGDMPGLFRVDGQGMTVAERSEISEKPELASKLGFDLKEDRDLLVADDIAWVPPGAVSFNKRDVKELPVIAMEGGKPVIYGSPRRGKGDTRSGESMDDTKY